MFGSKLYRIFRPCVRRFSTTSEKGECLKEEYTNIISRLETIDHNQRVFHRQTIVNNLFIGFATTYFFVYTMYSARIVRIKYEITNEQSEVISTGK